MRCPKCGSEIKYLEATILVYENYRFRVDENGYADYDFRGSIDEGTMKFYCPHCGELLAESEEEAKKLLLGK